MRSALEPHQEASTTADSHYPVQTGRITKLGSQHHYIGPGSPGLMRLTYPWGVKDKFKKGCKPVLTPFRGYHALNFIGRNGDFDGEDFVVNYERDMWMAQASQFRLNLLREYSINDLTGEFVARMDQRGYSRLIIELMPMIVTRLSINAVGEGNMKKEDRETNRSETLRLIGLLSTTLQEMLERGDRIADIEGGFEVEETPEERKYKKISIMAGNEAYIDSGLDVGKI